MAKWIFKYLHLKDKPQKIMAADKDYVPDD